MTDVDNQTTDPGAVGSITAAAGLEPVATVRDVPSLSELNGPFLATDVVDEAGEVRAVVAVLGGSEGADALLDRLVGAAEAETGPGTSRQSADAADDGAALAQRFSMPFSVSAFGDGSAVTTLYLVGNERRGSGASEPQKIPVPDGLDKLINVALDVSVELGRTRVTLAEVLNFDVGSVVELDRAAGAPVDIRVNDTLLAQGEVVLVDDEYAVRITSIVDPSQRL
jgi:flagellar motor switch protein FliN/FliY